MKDFFNRIDKERKKDVEVITGKYRAIGPLLTKMEGLITQTNTGRSPKMHAYYSHIEKRIFEALNNMVIRNIVVFGKAINTPTPLFQVSAVLSNPDVIMQPSLNDIYRLTVQSVRDSVEVTKNFVRWMAGTCIETPPQDIENQDEPFIFSFYDDVTDNPVISELFIQITKKEMTSVLSSLQKYTDAWKRFKKLWKLDKNHIMEKFSNKQHSCMDYDDMLQTYSRLVEEIKSKPVFYYESCIRLNLTPLQKSVQEHAQSWLTGIGNLLNTSTLKNLVELEEQLSKLKRDLEMHPNSLEELKQVLGTISHIRRVNMDTDFEIKDITERYRTLGLYKLKVEETQLERVEKLHPAWDGLVLLAKQVDVELTPTKMKFTKITGKEITKFKSGMEKFAEDFAQNGPSSIGSDLDKGLELMTEYIVKLKEFEDKRTELVNAEKLFDLEITAYPNLTTVSKQMHQLKQIYALYEEQQQAREEWAQTLWSNLNVNQLSEGIAGYIKQLKKMPKEVRSSTVGRQLDAKMLEFKNSIPLFGELKHESLRDRHWKTLRFFRGYTTDLVKIYRYILHA